MVKRDGSFREEIRRASFLKWHNIDAQDGRQMETKTLQAHITTYGFLKTQLKNQLMEYSFAAREPWWTKKFRMFHQACMEGMFALDGVCLHRERHPRSYRSHSILIQDVTAK